MSVEKKGRKTKTIAKPVKALDDRYHPVIDVIDDNYTIPQLGTSRRITALLPHNYHNSDRHYPVLYLHDGQNLFNEESRFGNWAIDKRLARLAADGLDDIIIISIDHGHRDRIKEYNPYVLSRFRKAKGRKYVRFIVETLKSQVDKTYRTKPEREYTGIGGSSMGGLISMWAGLTWSEVFSKLMVFSPSFWISPLINYNSFTFTPAGPMDVYFYAGEKESKLMIPQLKKVKSILTKRSTAKAPIKTRFSIHPEGEHHEHYWGEEFPEAVKWLYFEE